MTLKPTTIRDRPQAYVHASSTPRQQASNAPMTGESKVLYNFLGCSAYSHSQPRQTDRGQGHRGELCCSTRPSRRFEIEQGLNGGTQVGIRCLGRKKGLERKRKMGKKKGVPLGPALLPYPRLHHLILHWLWLCTTSGTCAGGAASESCMLTKRTKRGAGLRPPENGTGIYCSINSSQAMIATRRPAGPGPPSEPNALLCAEKVEGA